MIDSRFGRYGWVLCCHLLLACYAGAETIVVDRSGNSRFRSIQDGVDHASSGDTIRILPGRYDDFREVSFPGGFTEKVCVHVVRDSLLIMASEPGKVIIGPTTPAGNPGGDPKGILALADISSVRIRGIILENVLHQVYCASLSCFVENCVFSHGQIGIGAWCADRLIVEDSVFQETGDISLVTFAPTGNVRISRCRFTHSPENDGGELIFQATEHVEIRDCRISGGGAGLNFQDGTTGSLVGCRIENVQRTAVAVLNWSTVELFGNITTGASTCLMVRNNAKVVGRQNIFSGADFYTVVIDLPGNKLALSENSLLPGGEGTVRVSNIPWPPVETFALGKNSWGTTRPDSIANLIHDGKDDPDLYGIVDFHPPVDPGVEATRATLGGMRARFGR